MAASECEGENNQAPRVLVRAKSNNGKNGGGFGYDIEPGPLYERPDIIATRIAWLDPIDGNAREVLSDAESSGDPGDAASKLEQAERFLNAALANGERPAAALKSKASQEGISERTLNRASNEITIKRKEGAPGWFW
jgi:hypothetical protein